MFKYSIIERQRIDFIFTANERPEAEQKDFSGESRDPKRVTVACTRRYEEETFKLSSSLTEARQSKNPQALVPLRLTLQAAEQGDYPHDFHSIEACASGRSDSW